MIVNGELARDYLQKLERKNYLATTSFVFLVTISFLWSLFQIGGNEGVDLVANAMYTLSAAIGAFLSCATAYRLRRGPVQLALHLQLAWLLIGLGLIANCIGGIFYTYLEQQGILNPVPSVSDIGFTLFYPLTFAGLLLMPKSLRFRKRMALDSLITTLCILGVSWYFFISTVYLANRNAHESLFTFIVTISYLFWDMLLILAIVLLIQRRTEPILRVSLALFTAGILCQIWADTGYTLAINTYATGLVYIDPFWVMGFLLFGLSALYQYSALVRKAYNDQAHPTQAATKKETGIVRSSGKSQHRQILLQSTLIYLPLIVLLILMLYSEYTDEGKFADRSFFLVILTAIVGILVAFRYLVATHENEILLQAQEQGRQEADYLRLLGTELTNIFELDQLLDRIVTIATSELGFEAAMLLLIESDGPLDAQSRLLIRAAHDGTCRDTRAGGPGCACPEPTVTWQLVGTQLANCTVLLGHERDVIWSKESIKLPAEVAKWHQEQHIKATFFVPVIYQEKNLGSLGFASRREEYCSSHDSVLAKAYTELVSTVIEHTRLYQTISEKEAFAKGMANIATRLNAAVVEPAEIHQLICTEAAYALRADYALLYVQDKDGKLVPLATFINEQEPQTTLDDWPPIYLHEYEAQAFSGLESVLIRLNVSRSMVNNPPSLLRDKLAQRFVQSAILAPLIAAGEPLGLLILARSLPQGAHEKRSFSFAHLPQAQDFAEQAGVAFTNAQMYQRERAAHQRLQELDQLKDQFMITASHELRTPLTSVQGYIELMAQYDEHLPAEQRREFLQKARRSCEELVVLLGNVMDASRLEIEAGILPAHLEQVIVQDMIHSVIDLIEPQLAQGQRGVLLAIPPELAVWADNTRLRQVLMNISVNALKYSPPPTPIAFSACAVVKDKRYVLISITDKGKGITPQDQQRLFERFVRLESDINSVVRGSGLGLFISRRLVEAMGGKVWVESSGIAGEGSTFHIQLPMAQ